MRIFLGTVEIAGIGRALAQGFKLLGHDAAVVTSVTHPFSYSQGERTAAALRLWRWIGDRAAQSQSKPLLFSAKIAARALSFFILAWAISRFDAFVYLYGQTITKTRLELAILRALRKKIIFVYVGSDARPPYLDGAYFLSDTVDRRIANIRTATLKTISRLRQHERYATYLVNAPGTAQLSARPYVNWFALGLPTVPRANVESCAKHSAASVRILHCPSHPAAKGSALIEQAISNLLAKGHRIELVKLTGVPNGTVLDELSTCDFIVDQVYSDTPMAMFSAEAASMGVPSVVAGYFAEHAGKYIATDDMPPTLYINPTDLEKAIELMIVDVEFRRDLGRRAQKFVNDRWSLEQVASRYLRLLEGAPPTEWLLEAGASAYAYGAGAPIEAIGRVIKDLVTLYGEAALGVDDKPALKQQLLHIGDLR